MPTFILFGTRDLLLVNQITIIISCFVCFTLFHTKCVTVQFKYNSFARCKSPKKKTKYIVHLLSLHENQTTRFICFFWLFSLKSFVCSPVCWPAFYEIDIYVALKSTEKFITKRNFRILSMFEICAGICCIHITAIERLTSRRLEFDVHISLYAASISWMPFDLSSNQIDSTICFSLL